MREMRGFSLGLSLLSLVLCAGVLGAQRRWSKFGVPEIYLRSPDELGLTVPGDVAYSFQNLLVQSAGPSVYERFRLAAEALFSVTLRLQSLLEDIRYHYTPTCTCVNIFWHSKNSHLLGYSIRGEFDSAKNHKRQRRKRQCVTADEKSSERQSSYRLG